MEADDVDIGLGAWNMDAKVLGTRTVATLRQILTFELLGPAFQMKQSCPPSQNDGILPDIALRMFNFRSRVEWFEGHCLRTCLPRTLKVKLCLFPISFTRDNDVSLIVKRLFHN